ncbi:MAG: hypothetical protein R3A48_21985 [Polyangiales bacterium]
MNKSRAFLWFDAVATALGGLVCLAAPRDFIAGYFVSTGDPLTLVFVRWLGLMFMAFAAVEVRGLLGGDRAFWRLVLPAFVLGDSLHFVGTVARLLDPRFHWTFSSATDFVLVVVYLPARAWLALHPERLDRPAR